MENISIQSLRELRTRGLNNIITGCISEGVGEDDIRSIISEFSNTNLKYPVPAPMISICFRYLKAFFKIHYGDIVWKVIDNIPIGLEGESFICWYHNGEHHYVMLNKESYDELIGMCTMLEFVNKKEEGEEKNMDFETFISKQTILLLISTFLSQRHKTPIGNSYFPCSFPVSHKVSMLTIQVFI